ncbi:MAG: cupin domain-containing protein [Deltaproteobacteria bacterium]|jgi:quercetin dioxygenase-like cupin family protein|nr:cupin domain-containing protein [Deltaproteobacteria bacterium]
MATSIFKLGTKASTARFTGPAFVNTLVSDPGGVYNLAVHDVKFEPGARNNWHSHPQGQILLCTGGVGYYQERGKPPRRLEKGDVVEIPPDAHHWHGAAPDSVFYHLGITPNANRGQTEWYGPVSYEEYRQAAKPAF